MNRVILKQQKEKQEKEQTEKKKSKLKERQEPVTITQEIIEDRLFSHFQNHIGEQNKTTLEEVFQTIMGVSSKAVDSFSRFYWIETIKKIMRKLRRTNQCFIIQKGGNFFVLKSENECAYYQNLCDNSISKMEKAKTRAEVWVDNESWRNMTRVKLKPREKTISEKIEEQTQKTKTKVVKLYEDSENENPTE